MPSSQRPHHSRLPTSCFVKNGLVSISPSSDCDWPSLDHSRPTECWLLAVPSSGQNNARLWPPTLAWAGLPSPGLPDLTPHISAGFPQPRLLCKEGLAAGGWGGAQPHTLMEHFGLI